MGLLDRFKKKKEEPKQAPKPKKVHPKDGKEPVSYTHLRAHET